MDAERKINLCEGMPLNSTGAANIFLNTSKNRKDNDGTVIHLNTGTSYLFTLNNSFTMLFTLNT